MIATASICEAYLTDASTLKLRTFIGGGGMRSVRVTILDKNEKEKASIEVDIVELMLAVRTVSVQKDQ